MAGRYLLDTNIVIALFAAEPGIQKRLSAALEVFVSAVTIGELRYGAEQSTHREENLARIEEFARSVVKLPIDFTTARHYGEIKARLRSKGRPLPENDIWIAAVAAQHGMTLVSRDAHFHEIDALLLETWAN